MIGTCCLVSVITIVRGCGTEKQNMGLVVVQCGYEQRLVKQMLWLYLVFSPLLLSSHTNRHLCIAVPLMGIKDYLLPNVSLLSVFLPPPPPPPPPFSISWFPELLCILTSTYVYGPVLMWAVGMLKCELHPLVLSFHTLLLLFLFTQAECFMNPAKKKKKKLNMTWWLWL